MSQTLEIVLALGLLAGVYILARKIQVYKIHKTYQVILRDLEEKEAVSPNSAVALPYAQVRLFRFGMRDYRPKALEYLVLGNVVGMTGEDRYYLKSPPAREQG